MLPSDAFINDSFLICSDTYNLLTPRNNTLFLFSFFLCYIIFLFRHLVMHLPENDHGKVVILTDCTSPVSKYYFLIFLFCMLCALCKVQLFSANFTKLEITRSLCLFSSLWYLLTKGDGMRSQCGKVY